MMNAHGATLPPRPAEEEGTDLPSRYRLLRAAIEGTTDSLFVKDLHGRYLMINAPGARMLRRPIEEIVGRTDAELLSAEDAGPLMARDREVMEGGTTVTLVETLTIAGETRIFHSTKGPYLDAEGQVIGIVGMSRTDAEDEEDAGGLQALNDELEQRVRDRTAELETALADLEGFSYSVSHDLRAPLRAINGYARVLLEDHVDQVTPEGRRALDRISHNATRMGELIDGLLRFSRLGRQEVDREDADAAALVESAVDELRQAYPDHAVAVSLGPLGAITCDPAMLRQVFVNLISNAWKFTEGTDNPSVEVVREDSETEATFTIRDNGVGFDPRHKDKLFGVFQRLHASEFAGEGIGLALSSRVIHRHGGRIWGDGAIGEGATFSFTIPKEVSR